jgi:chitinase
VRTLLALALLLTAPALACAAEPKVVGYFVEWGVYDRKYHVKDVPADKLTHLNYAFAKIADGECAVVDPYAATDKAYPGDKQDPGVLRGNFNQLQQLKKQHPHLKTLISVGGWTLSGPFSDAALTKESRAKLAKSCVAFMKKYEFDGVDIDWEYPVGGGLESNKKRPEDKQNFTLLLAELRAQLDEAGKADKKQYLLTIAAPAGARNMVNLELDKIHPYLDWLNLMAYDFHGPWEKTTNLNTPQPAPAATVPFAQPVAQPQVAAPLAEPVGTHFGMGELLEDERILRWIEDLRHNGTLQRAREELAKRGKPAIIVSLANSRTKSSCNSTRLFFSTASF